MLLSSSYLRDRGRADRLFHHGVSALVNDFTSALDLQGPEPRWWVKPLTCSSQRHATRSVTASCRPYHDERSKPVPPTEFPRTGSRSTVRETSPHPNSCAGTTLGHRLPRCDPRWARRSTRIGEWRATSPAGVMLVVRAATSGLPARRHVAKGVGADHAVNPDAAGLDRTSGPPLSTGWNSVRSTGRTTADAPCARAYPRQRGGDRDTSSGAAGR